MSTSTSRAYWELRAEQVMDRVFCPLDGPSAVQAVAAEPPQPESIEVEVTEAPALPTPPAITPLVWICAGITGLALITAGLLGLALLVAKLNAHRHSVATTLPVISQVAPFTLTNQLGQPVTLDSLKGHPWVGDIIFTRCAGPCPVMTRKMRELQDALPGGSAARLITLTTDPEADTPAVLNSYAEKFGANTAQWNFLTGDKVTIGRVAIDGLKLTTVPKKPEERNDAVDLFVHSTIFMVVDKQGQLRATFQTQGDLVDWNESKKQILATLKQLEHER